MKNSEKFPDLLNCALLDDMPVTEKAAFLDQCIAKQHTKATEILTQGELPSGIYIIAAGTAEISFITPNGNRAIITHLGTGEAMGEAEVIGQLPCVATAVAPVGTTTLLCPNSRIRTVMQSEFFIRNVARTYVGRMLRDNQFKAIDQFQPVEQRISSYLWHLSTADPVVRVSQSYLANVAGCSRQTVNRVLGRLRDDGLIAIRKEEIEVLNAELLSAQIANSA